MNFIQRLLARYVVRGTRVNVPVTALSRQAQAITGAEEANKKVGWFYRCVQVKAQNVQQVPVYGARVVRGKGKGRVDRLLDANALSMLLARPNAEDDLSFLLEGISTHLDLRGEALLEMDSGEIGGQRTPPANLYIHPAQWIREVEFDPSTRAYARFNLEGAGRRYHIPGEDGIFFKTYNPENPIRGLAPASAAMQAAETAYSAQLFNQRFFDRAGVISIVYSFTKDSPVQELTREVRERIREELRNLTSGQDNWHSSLIAGPGEELKVIGGSKDMDFEALLKFTAREISAVLGVPPILCGDVDNANRANSREQRAMFWMDTVIPRCQDIETLLNRKLAPRFGPDIRILFDYSQVPALRRDMKEFADSWVPLIETDVVLINEAREELGKDPVPWGDDRWSLVSQGNAEPDEADGSTENEKPKPGEEENEKAFTAEAARRWIGEMKNAALSRIRETGANTPMAAFPVGREIRKAVKKFGVPPELARALATAIRTELAVQWEAGAPERSVADLFDHYTSQLPKAA